ncbi:MAG: bifunctional diaminohydroxyphosphoribosylaminopyrimidine deaminase/5-amino-6-(5-phosphoribosylamino)uracil reductase RibD [Candidatus Sumerlaeota bacterium]|nr:bifunctional diaminohydroxyphosphoribosylaminopyrimidine deaminase/5-amino-6-(5-phosphoribosylamino)uracil reductase RibD [Candidatus Sumerlaeota bacterium]
MNKENQNDTGGFSRQEREFMKMALRLAARAQGQTSPNPCVGAVIARGGKVLGQGFHRRAGEDHAEVAALKDAGGGVKGATICVSLEPCAHHGRTPPCVNAILTAGLRRVVIATLDADPRVRGRGARQLREAGLDVAVGLMREEAIALNESFMQYHLTGLPLVTCKWAITLDGQAAAGSGDSKWITNLVSRQYVHRLRSQHDAVLAGIGTVLADNPSLNVRLPRYAGRQPIRIIADGALRTPRHANCISAQPGGQTWFLATEAAGAERIASFEQSGCRVIQFGGRRRILDMPRVIRTLGREGIQSLFVEGGPAIHAALIGAGLCDKIVAFVAPKAIGTRRDYRRAPVYGWGQDLMSQALALERAHIQHFDGDVCIEGDTRPWEQRFGPLLRDAF